jgi:ATP-dependent RNA helicase RhlE
LDFSDFGLHPDILDGIEVMKYPSPTPIQEQAIPLILDGKDLIGTAQTGTGKTAAFVLPILHHIRVSGEANYTQALVIVPTRELAAQIDQVIEAYSYYTGVSSIAIYGGGDGKEFAREKNALTGGVDIVIATPGRLIAHLNMGYVNFSRLRFLILDEADRMLDMGFMPDLTKIIDKINPQRQSLLFSATMPQVVLKLAKTLLHDPVMVKIAVSKPAEGVTQSVFMVSEHHKLGLITELLGDKIGQRIIIFGSTKRSVSALYQKLRSKGLPVGMVSSDIEQEMREQVMLDYRNSKIDILVATDVLSRGIDVDGIDIVVNYDVPNDAEDYVHRIGRTARAARKGAAVTLVSPTDMIRFRRIEAFLGKEVPRQPLPPGFSADSADERRPSHRDGKKRRPPQSKSDKSRGRNPERREKPAVQGASEKVSRPPIAPALTQANAPAATAPGDQQPAKKKKKRHRGSRGRRENSGNPNPPPPIAS